MDQLPLPVFQFNLLIIQSLKIYKFSIPSSIHEILSSFARYGLTISDKWQVQPLRYLKRMMAPIRCSTLF
jgi:hypothetical protein